MSKGDDTAASSSSNTIAAAEAAASSCDVTTQRGGGGAEAAATTTASRSMSRSSVVGVVGELAGLVGGGARAVVVTGAGLSVASGVPTYRGGDKAIWDKYITDWGTTEKFFADPEVWWNEYWVKTHHCDAFLAASPNRAHVAISNIMNRYPNVTLITQNIDKLHSAAGVPPDRYVEIHGCLGKYRCTNKKCTYSREVHPEVELLRNPAGLVIPAKCILCTSLLLPLALFFDESYDAHPAFKFDTAMNWIYKAEVFIFVGTSLSVGITGMILQNAARFDKPVYIFNLDNTGSVAAYPNVITGPCTETLPAFESLLL
ncbi:NAD-dependent deacytelase Sir2 [Pelomyxa schiedti]|nr:NAD-dependent deacytelase Sir2 [Pelomyxa schiedti]